MSWLDEELSAQFTKWERRCRGWEIWPQAVAPEPPFVPFSGFSLDPSQFADDGKRPSWLVSSLQRLGLITPPNPEVPKGSIPADTAPESLTRSNTVELEIQLPGNRSAHGADFALLLRQLTSCREPVSFELFGTSKRIFILVSAHPSDAATLKRHLKTSCPDAVLTETQDVLQSVWESTPNSEALIVEFGLKRESLYPLAIPKDDPYVGIISLLGDLFSTEIGLFQVIFSPVQAPWVESILRLATNNTGQSAFSNAPGFPQLAQAKISSPLFGVILRLAARADEYDRTVEIVSGLASSLRLYAGLDSNELIPLHNVEYPYEEHLEDVSKRQCHRSGMLLNCAELAALVHIPSPGARSPKLVQLATKTKTAPDAFTVPHEGLRLGCNSHAGRVLDVHLPLTQRGHMHLIGASGTGKSTLLFNLIRQDIENGEGVAILDPHGDLIEDILDTIPEHRINDVVLIDPADDEYSVGFNILAAHTDLEKSLLASDLTSIFQRLSTSWGDQMESVLQNAILAVLESKEGGTLADLRRFLIEPAFRNRFLSTVVDPDVVYYWQKVFPQLSGGKSLGPVLTRLQNFLARKPIRFMVSQRENKLNFARLMGDGMIFLAKLAQGQIGKENAFLLGSLLVSKFQQTAMSRQAQEAALRRPYWLYIDEFPSFMTPSMGEILAGARKYRLGLILAHQDLRQLQRDPEVASAVLSNCHARVCFRLGDDDARKLAEGFSSFNAMDLQSLGLGEAVCRLGRSNYDFNLAVTRSDSPDPQTAAKTRLKVIHASRASFATPREQVEKCLQEGLASVREQDKERATRVAAIEPSELQKSPSPIPAALSTHGLLTECEPSTGTEETTPTNPEKQPRDLGRGGAQHKAIQKRLKEAAEKLGFRANIEEIILEGHGSVDLLLKRPGTALPCEISINTTIDHEVGNVAKCLKAGFSQVVVICACQSRLNKIEKAVKSAFGAEMAANVSYFEPDPFIEYLHSLKLAPSPASVESKAEVRRGYKVKRSFNHLTPEEQRQREDAAIRLISESMQQPKS